MIKLYLISFLKVGLFLGLIGVFILIIHNLSKDEE